MSDYQKKLEQAKGTTAQCYGTSYIRYAPSFPVD